MYIDKRNPNMNILYKFPSKLIGFPFLFVYWDKKAEVLEFNIFGKVSYYWIEKGE
jgi:hypothetical protein